MKQIHLTVIQDFLDGIFDDYASSYSTEVVSVDDDNCRIKFSIFGAEYERDFTVADGGEISFISIGEDNCSLNGYRAGEEFLMDLLYEETQQSKGSREK